MTVSKYSIIVTSINAPNKAMAELCDGSAKIGAKFWIIGDSKSPKDFSLPGAEYLDVEAQVETGFKYARIVPVRHYARKNVGYLCAMRDGADVIIETDDDNLPLPAFWDERKSWVKARFVSSVGWHNVYRHFSSANIWPRGLPLTRLQDECEPYEKLPITERFCPIQQGLADENPDVDAIYRLVLPLPVTFQTDRAVILDRGVWCPFNSQNTTWWHEAFSLLYLPFHCSFRMTDIWRSFVAQRIAWENGWPLYFHSATVWQDRNEHDLMRDFNDEIVGYQNNAKIADALSALDLKAGADAMGDNLIACYEVLIGLGVVGFQERPLVEAWIEDVDRLNGARA
jgi:hypothetical protein